MDSCKSKAIESVIRLSLELLNATQGAFLSADTSSLTLRFDVVAIRHGVSELLEQTSKKLLGGTVAFGDGVTGRAAITKKAQFSTRNSGGDMSHVVGDGTPNAVVAVPVMKGDRLLGVLTAVCFDGDLEFTGDSARQYQLAATVVAELVSE